MIIEADQEQIDESLDDVAEEASKLGTYIVQYTRCSLQLEMVLKTANLIGKLRQVAVAARTPKIDVIVKIKSGKGVILDQVTRWGSTYFNVSQQMNWRSLFVLYTLLQISYMLKT